ncbi:hypothetical protein Q0F98_25630 [Paenibacillus amylolyticus]|nr:hypothetical protein Q0F98_25630 [Paenibacillus amylolyticus]
MTDKNEAIQKDENTTIDNLSITTCMYFGMIDAIEKANSDIRVCLWAPLQWGTNFCKNDDS